MLSIPLLFEQITQFSRRGVNVNTALTLGLCEFSHNPFVNKEVFRNTGFFSQLYVNLSQGSPALTPVTWLSVELLAFRIRLPLDSFCSGKEIQESSRFITKA